MNLIAGIDAVAKVTFAAAAAYLVGRWSFRILDALLLGDPEDLEGGHLAA